MHVELVDLFRCPVSHEDSWLIAAAHHTEQRVIVDGLLGCPVCGAEYTISDGVTTIGRVGALATPTAMPTADDALRLAALLSLDAPHKTVALVGYDLRMARALQQIVPTRIVVVNTPPALPTTYGNEPTAVLLCGAHIPIADNALDGIAFAFPGIATNAVALLRTYGRLVAPADVPVPDGVDELARDTHQWVAARRVVSSSPVALTRQSSTA